MNKRASEVTVTLARKIEKQLELPEMPKPAEAPKQPKDPIFEALLLTPYVFAPEVKEMAEDLMDNHSGRWKAVPEIVYLFSQKAPKAHGDDATATCRKVGGLTAYLLRKQMAEQRNRNSGEYNRETWREKFDADHTFVLPSDRHVVKATPLFVITWHYQVWRWASENLRLAVTDHELYHIGVDYAERGDGYRYHIIPHTVEEFAVIANRYGAYREELKQFQAALQNGELARRAERDEEGS